MGVEPEGGVTESKIARALRNDVIFANRNLAPNLQPGERVGWAMMGFVAGLSSVRKYLISVTDRRIIICLLTRGRAFDHMVAGYPLGAPIVVQSKARGMFVRIGDFPKALAIERWAASDLEYIGSHGIAKATNDEPVVRPPQDAVTRYPLTAKQRAFRLYMRGPSRKLLFIPPLVLFALKVAGAL